MQRKDNLFLLTLSEIYKNHFIPNNAIRFLSPDIGIVRSFRGILEIARMYFKIQQPYRLTEGRILFFRSGTCRLRVNLKELTLTEGQLIVASPGSVFEFVELSAETDLSMLAFPNELMEGWFKDELIQTYQQGRLFINITATDDFSNRFEKIFNLIWDIVHDNDYSKDDIRSLIILLIHQINSFQKKEEKNNHIHSTRQEDYFNGFLSLINQHSTKERSVSFYADKLCITPRYLSTLIKKESGRTVMDWINEATIQEIKLQLRHSDKMVYQIADEMNFPNSSFFTKYFKRLTGMTPKEYRETV